MKNELRDTPYGEHRHDSDFTIGEVKATTGEPIYGIIYYAGGESWGDTDYKAAIACARRTCARMNSYA